MARAKPRPGPYAQSEDARDASSAGPVEFLGASFDIGLLRKRFRRCLLLCQRITHSILRAIQRCNHSCTIH